LLPDRQIGEFALRHQKPHIDPRMHMHFLRALHEERVAILSLLRFQWPIVLLFLLGVATLVFVSRPLPPSHVRLAAGQPNSSLEVLATKYADYFKRNGVQVDLVTTAGAFENIELLKKGTVDAALSIGGISVGKDATKIVSLGSVEYQPFWLFYRGAEFAGSNPSVFFEGKTFSVNIPGSGTRHLTEKILSLHGMKIDGNPRLVSFSSGESVDALRSGKIDGVFLVAGLDSKTIEGLIAIPNIHIFNFSVADAYAKRLKYLEVVKLPHGSIDLKRAVPLQDSETVATTTTVLANDKLHPAIQHLFLEASNKIYQDGQDFFSRPGGFPAHIERDIPLSTVAERFYTKGPPALNGYVPYWIASLIDRIWFILFAAFAIGYPLTKIIPNYRELYAHFCMTDCYESLVEIDLQLVDTLRPDELHALLVEFHALEQRIDQLWVPASLKADFYFLRGAVDIVRGKAANLQKRA